MMLDLRKGQNTGGGEWVVASQPVKVLAVDFACGGKSLALDGVLVLGLREDSCLSIVGFPNSSTFPLSIGKSTPLST
jgi:hypothetical protein